MLLKTTTKVNTGIFLIVVALTIAIQTFRTVNHSQLTRGTVVHIESRQTGSDGSMTYIPTILFFDKVGKEHQISTMYSTYNFKMGKELAIYYDPKNVSALRLGDFYSLWSIPLLLTSLGFFLLLTSKRNAKGL